MPLIVILLAFMLTSCEKQPPHSSYIVWQDIQSRDEGVPSSRFPLYKAKVPKNWQRYESLLSESLVDTKKALCEFHIVENEDLIRITVHNFPPHKDTPKTPSIAQIQRWKKQFDELDPILTNVTPSAHGGFVGLYLEGQGILKGEPTKILGWSMQLAPDYDQKLGYEDSFVNKQKRAAYTIKVLGPPSCVNKHLKIITTFANSFELIDELPSPL